MCLSPVTIPNPSKYVSLRYRDRFLMQVPCNHCAECQSNNSNAWFYRSWIEFNDCLNAGGYVMFDTLTYRPADLPKISDYFDNMPYDFGCFNHKHLRLFNEDLRRTVKRKYKDVFVRTFCASEYGEKTHRPHYHYLFFVYGNIDPIEFSLLVAKKWKYGRTDGIPYKSKNYVLSHNIIRQCTDETRLLCCNYVTKYVQKSSAFDKYINVRIDKVMQYIATRCSDKPENWLRSRHSRRVRQRVKSLCGQFHRQSQQFGASELQNIDLISLIKDGCLFMPHYKGVKVPIPLPMYYKRKLFQEQIIVNGQRCWSWTDLGMEYKKKREEVLIEKMKSRFDCVAVENNVRFPSAMSEYVFKRRGRLLAPLEEVSLKNKLEHIDVYAYVHRSDLERYGVALIREKFCGLGIKRTPLRGSSMKLEEFVQRFVYVDDFMEKCLDDYYNFVKHRNKGKQRAFDLKQHLEQVFKNIC